MNPCGLRLVLGLSLCSDGGRAVVLQPSVLLLLLLLLLQDVGHCVQQVVEELVGVLLHVVVEQIWRERERERAQLTETLSRLLATELDSTSILVEISHVVYCDDTGVINQCESKVQS